MTVDGGDSLVRAKRTLPEIQLPMRQGVPLHGNDMRVIGNRFLKDLKNIQVMLFLRVQTRNLVQD